jgi:hypothetical protein
MSARAPGWTRPKVGPRQITGVLRIVLAAVAIIALIGDYGYVLGFTSFATYNFFSYFTVHSALAAVAVFVLASLVSFRHEADPAWLDQLRILVTTYLIVSGTVFFTIVIQSSSRDYVIDVPWSSQLLHFWIPFLALIDWLADSGKARLKWKSLRWVAVYPLLWGGFTLIRGPLVGWYPYFFLDPVQVSSPWETLGYCAIALALIMAIATALTGTSRIRWRTRPPL